MNDDSNKIILIQRQGLKKAESLITNPKKYFAVFSARLGENLNLESQSILQQAIGLVLSFFSDQTQGQEELLVV